MAVAAEASLVPVVGLRTILLVLLLQVGIQHQQLHHHQLVVEASGCTATVASVALPRAVVA